MVSVEQFTGPITYHGEGPVWFPDGRLRCVDMLAGDVLDLDENGGARRIHVGAVAAVARPRTAGGMVVAAERGLVLFEADGSRTRLVEVFSDPGVRLNEGGCDPDGRFYCGSMGYHAEPGRGRFYRFAADGSAEVVLPEVTISNGFAFSPDGATAYYIDTPTQRVDAFDYSTEHGLTRRRAVLSLDPEHGSPDGLTVDAAGHLWVACWGGGAVRRFTPDGHLDEVIAVPARQVTACAVGGPRLDRLFITTSREGLSDAQAGEAGSIFVVDGVPPGLPVLPAAL
jgi:sugar lactone lactonase YvrE